MFDNPASLKSGPSKGGYFRSVEIVWSLWSFLTNLAAQCCTFSILSIGVVVCGFHIGEEYSSLGWTSMLYAVSFTSGLHGPRVCLIIPKKN